jgi:hypothetical protein
VKPLERRWSEGGSEKRTTDLTINLKARLDCRELDDGTFVLEIGQDKHLIFIIPKATGDESYDVWAELAPAFARQCWLTSTPLGWAQEYAERQARRLSSDEHKVVLVDRHARWRNLPVDPCGKQAAFLKRFGIAGWETLTRGEASEILDREFAALDKDRERRKTEHHAKKTMKAGAALQTRKGAHHHVNP